MPTLGEIVKDCRTVGYNKRDAAPVIWHACEKCGKERWVFVVKGKPRSLCCVQCRRQQCRGEQNPSWKGGRFLVRGYIQLRLQPDDFFYPMVSQRGYIPEHRLIMAKHLSRCLLPWEVVHHRNGIKDDNRVENLQLLPNGVYHVSDSVLKQKLRYAQKRITEQSLEIRELKAKIKHFGHPPL